MANDGIFGDISEICVLLEMTGDYWKFVIPYLAKVGVGGSNPLARSNFLP